LKIGILPIGQIALNVLTELGQGLFKIFPDTGFGTKVFGAIFFIYPLIDC
jgi:hypothetical protein